MNRKVIAVGLITICAAGSSVGPAVAQPANWSGPYVGVFGGYGTGSSSQHDDGIPVAAVPVVPPVVVPPPVVPPAGPPVVAAADGRYSLGGGFGGGLAGYNYQINQFVIGVEADLAAGGVSGKSGTCGTPLHVCGTNIDGLANVRGRIGFAIDRFLPYIAGGLAVDRLQAYDTLFGSSGSAWRAGYTIGGGVEYKITPAFSIRAEYLHAQIGSTNFFAIVPGVPERVAARTDLFRVGVSYSFYPPSPPPTIVAKY